MDVQLKVAGEAPPGGMPVGLNATVTVGGLGIAVELTVSVTGTAVLVMVSAGTWLVSVSLPQSGCVATPEILAV